MEVKIEKGIAIPKFPSKPTGDVDKSGGMDKCLFGSFEVGDSAAYPYVPIKNQKKGSIKTKIQSTASVYGKRHNKKFVCRNNLIEDGKRVTRVWRVR